MRNASGIHGFLRHSGGSIDTFDVPGGVYQVSGMNNRGDTCGYTQNFAGFVRWSDGTVTEFSVQPNQATVPSAINDSGTVTGYYTTPSSEVGFIWTSDGNITTFAVGNPTRPLGTNANGDIAGRSGSGANVAPFLRFGDGTFAKLRYPAPAGAASGINGTDQLIGDLYYAWNAQGQHYNLVDAFVWSNGKFTQFSCDPRGINSAGDIAGGCAFGVGFLRTSDGTMKTFIVPAKGQLADVVGLNDSDVIVGWTEAPLGSTSQGFLRFP